MRPASLSLLLSLCAVSAAQRRIEVVNEKGPAISPDYYMMFFETEINFGSEGGLYAEMVRNRDFEALGRGVLGDEEPNEQPPTKQKVATDEEMLDGFRLSMDRTVDDPPPPIPTDFRPWSVTGGASASISSTDAPFETNNHTLVVTSNGTESGVTNPGYWGMNLPSDSSFNVSLYVRSQYVSSPSVDVTLYLRCGDDIAASRTFGITSKWQLVEDVVKTSPSVSCTDGHLYLQVNGQGTIAFDHVSVFPSDAVSGWFRPDLLEYFRELSPPLLRLPGGNYLEGTSLDSRWAWKKTIGERRARPGHFSPWKYWVTDGMGLHELLVLCEVLEIQPLVSIYTGYSMGKPYVPLNESQQFVQNALDLIEYANGNTSTFWGGQRAANGHPAPFNVTHLEVGNEERNMSAQGYPSHYKMITDAVWEKYPDMFIVASGFVVASKASGHRSGTCNPCVGGCGLEPQRCDVWDEHTYDRPDSMAALHSLYDNYTTTCHTIHGQPCPPLFVLEYAAQNFVGGTLQSAVSEALFLIGGEKNAAIVKGTSFAPILCNIKGLSIRTPYNLIVFNTSNSFAIPSFYSQKVLKDNLGDSLLTTRTFDDHPIAGNTWNATASLKTDSSGHTTVILKMVNYGPGEVPVAVSMGGFGSVSVQTAADIITGPPTSQNTLDSPTAVVNKIIAIPPSSGSFNYTLPPYSLVVIKSNVTGAMK